MCLQNVQMKIMIKVFRPEGCKLKLVYYAIVYLVWDLEFILRKFEIVHSKISNLIGFFVWGQGFLAGVKK